MAYRDLLNEMIGDVWATVEWKRVRKSKPRWETSGVPVKQSRLFPHFHIDKQIKGTIRAKHVGAWKYAAHWVDSAEKTAFAILQSWRKNYNRGERSGKCPRVSRLFALAKQSLVKIEGEKIRITIKPHEYIWVDLSKRYFKLPKMVSPLDLGEPSITPHRIHLPLYREEEKAESTVDWMGFKLQFIRWLFSGDGLDKDRHQAIISHP